jgi:N-methylhydantoinase A
LRYLIAADTGGTFTDLAVFDLETGEARFGKTLTDYEDLIEGVVRGLKDAEATISEAALVKHGTTHVINALLERRGARTALIATLGFRDVIEIARGNRSVPFDLRYRRQPPLVSRALRYEVAERVDGMGAVLRPLDLEGLKHVAVELRANGVQAVAIAFLNAYRNPVHEQLAKRYIEEALPGIFVTISSDLSREWSEYERSSTAAANAFVGPAMTAYLRRFESRLDGQDFPGRLYMMSSSGGVLAVDQAANQPIAMVESGRRLHCGGRICARAGSRFRDRLRYGRNHGKMRTCRERRVRFGLDLLYRRLRIWVADPYSRS